MTIGTRTDHLNDYGPNDYGPDVLGLRSFYKIGRESVVTIIGCQAAHALAGHPTFVSIRWDEPDHIGGNLHPDIHALVDYWTQYPYDAPHWLTINHEADRPNSGTTPNQWWADLERLHQITRPTHTAHRRMAVGPVVTSWLFDPRPDRPNPRHPNDWLNPSFPLDYLGVDHYPETTDPTTWATMREWHKDNYLEWPIILAEFGITATFNVDKVAAFVAHAATVDHAFYFDLNRNEAESTTNKDWTLGPLGRRRLTAYAAGHRWAQ